MSWTGSSGSRTALLSGKPGPVAIEMPWDIMAARGKATPLCRAMPDLKLEPDPADVERAARLLVEARAL